MGVRHIGGPFLRLRSSLRWPRALRVATACAALGSLLFTSEVSRAAAQCRPRQTPIEASPNWAFSYRLAAPDLAILGQFSDPAGWSRRRAWTSFWLGRYGPSRSVRRQWLTWSVNSCEPSDAGPAGDRDAIEWPVPKLRTVSVDPWRIDFSRVDTLNALSVWDTDAIAAPGLELISASTADRPCPAWRRPKPVTLARYNGEWDRFALLECDGSVAPEALDRLSIIARPPQAGRPKLPLPDEPDPASLASGEWLPNVRIVHPRLIWLVQRIGDAFPRKTLYVVSGYRPEASGKSLHHLGRALDLFVQGVPNESLFQFCRSLRDVGCGYYPNSNFVHVDIRPYGSPRIFWVDAAYPGEPSQYVDSWPGVVEGGALGWAGAE